MRVAIDSGPLTGGDAIRGIGFHTRELVDHLRKIKNLDLSVVDFRKENLSSYDIVHYPYFHPHFTTLPFLKRGKMVVTIHDLIRLVYPFEYPPGIKGALRFLIQKMNLRNVDAIITISETSKKDIVRFLKIPEEKIHVIYLAPQTIKHVPSKKDLLDTKNKYALPDKFVLYIGDVNYNKNINGLAEACKIAKVPLVIVGKQALNTQVDDAHIENRSFVDFIKKYGKDKDIVRVGYLSDIEFASIFKLASLYCQPSFYEGFGLPVLEAMHAGIPVVSSKTQSLVEICKNASLYVNPHSPIDIAKSIREVLSNKALRGKLVKKGKARASLFSWEKTAKETYGVYKTVFKS